MLYLNPLRLVVAIALFAVGVMLVPSILEEATGVVGLGVLAFFLSLPAYKWAKKKFLRPIIMFDVGGVLLRTDDRDLYDLTPMPGTFEMVEKLRANYCVVVFSNMSPESFGLYNSKWHFDQRFDYVFVSGFIKAKKPDSNAFALVARKLGVSPSNIVFFDDTAANVAGAKAAGINAIVFQNVTQAAQALRQMGVKV